MSDLLVGCRASYIWDEKPMKGVVVRTDNDRAGYIWILDEEGRIHTVKIDWVIIHPEDVRFINRLSKSYDIRKKILENTTERFEILDL